MTDEFLETLERILSENNIPQEAINKISVALALDAANRIALFETSTTATLVEIKDLIAGQTAVCNMLAENVRRIDDFQKTHPSLLYLARFRTRETAIAIILLFALLSIWWVSGFRQPILEFLGLPIF